MTTNYARLERLALADLMDALGPDAPTLCEGWTTRDMAAHLVVRDSRPDAALGLIISPLASYGEKVRAKYAQRDFHPLVDAVRNGPPMLSPLKVGALDKLVNTVEFFVHHEDVLRAQPKAQPRVMPAEEMQQLDAAVRRMAKLFLRKAPCGVAIALEGGEPFVAKSAEPMVTISGNAAEVLMFIEGRQAHSHVTLDGPPECVSALSEASFGI